MPNDSSIYKKIMDDLQIILNTQNCEALSTWCAEAVGLWYYSAPLQPELPMWPWLETPRASSRLPFHNNLKDLSRTLQMDGVKVSKLPTWSVNTIYNLCTPKGKKNPERFLPHYVSKLATTPHKIGQKMTNQCALNEIYLCLFCIHFHCSSICPNILGHLNLNASEVLKVPESNF